jgi:hypothetical protein
VQEFYFNRAKFDVYPKVRSIVFFCIQGYLVLSLFVTDVVRQHKQFGKGVLNKFYLVSEVPQKQSPGVVIAEPQSAIGYRE